MGYFEKEAVISKFAIAPVSRQKAFSCHGRTCLFEMFICSSTSLKDKVNLEFLLTIKEHKYQKGSCIYYLYYKSLLRSVVIFSSAIFCFFFFFFFFCSYHVIDLLKNLLLASTHTLFSLQLHLSKILVIFIPF